MSIVSNASLLINLSRIGKLDLLHDLYDEVIIPEAVWKEVVVEGTGQPGADAIETAAWIKKEAAKNRELVQGPPTRIRRWRSRSHCSIRRSALNYSLWMNIWDAKLPVTLVYVIRG